MKPARWPRLKKWFKRLAFALIAFVTLVALGLAIEGYRAKRAWYACQNELAALGESLDWQAHVAAPVPDDQNLLATPLLAACFGFDAGTEPLHEHADRTDACAELRRLSGWTDPLSGPGSWRRGTVVPLAEWQTTLRSTSLAGTKPLSAAMRADFAESFGGSPEDYETTVDPSAESALAALRSRPPAGPVDDLRFLLGMHQAELDEIRLAARRPFAQLPLDPSVFSETFLSRLGAFKGLARLFGISSWTELTAGNPEAAVTDVETMLALSDAAVSQPLLISALVQIAMVESAISPIWAGLAERRWDDAQLARLEARLDRVNLVADMRHCLRGERVFALTLLSAAQTRTELDSNVVGEDMMPLYRALRWWPRAFLYRNQINIARAYQEILIDPLDAAGPSVRLRKAAEDQATRASYKTVSPYNFFLPLLLPAVEAAAEKAAAGQVTVTLARVACVLERYRLADGVYPETLEELTPRFLDRIPPDPINGGPLLYRREDFDRFALYSVGPNENDDGGVTSAPAHGGSFGITARPGDWIWRSHPVGSP
jgi:hypothetical protein